MVIMPRDNFELDYYEQIGNNNLFLTCWNKFPQIKLIGDKMPKISVIIPVYHTAQYLRKCVDSVLNQSFQDFEIILVSDGPAEEHKICDEYAQKYNKIQVIKDVNKGLGGARNAGLDAAQGDYILFVDSDDWILPETMKKTLNIYIYNEVDLVVFDTEFENNCKITQQRIDEQNYISLKYQGIVDINRESIFFTNVHAWNKLWKKEIIDKYKIKFPDNVCFEDFPFYFKYIFMSKKAYYLKEKLYAYNRRDNSLMAETYNKKEFIQNKVHITNCEFLYHELKNSNIYEQCEKLYIELFDRWVSIALYHSKIFDRRKIKKLAYHTLKNLNLNVTQSKSLSKLKIKYERSFLSSLIQTILKKKNSQNCF